MTGFGAERMRRALGAAVRWLPLSGRGAALAVFSAASLVHYGYGQLDLLLFVLGLSGLALVLSCSAGTAFCAFRVKRRLARPELRAGVPSPWLETGTLFTTDLRLPAWRWVPLFGVRCRWLEPAGFECRLRPDADSQVEEVRASRRCDVTCVRRRFRVSDALGLARVELDDERSAIVRALPSRGRLTHAPLVASFAAADGIPFPSGAPEGDRMEIRRYVPGDSVRDILWKHFARTRTLHVRRPERAIDRSRRLVAYLVTGAGDEPAAAVARVALETGALGRDFRFGADGSDESASELGPALRILARSGAARQPGEGLGAFLAGVGSDAHCVVFAPARAGRWLAAVEAALRAQPGRLSVVLGVDGLARPLASRPRLQRWLFAPAPEAGVGADELEGLLRRLARLGVPASALDRVTGRVVGTAARPLPGLAA